MKTDDIQAAVCLLKDTDFTLCQAVRFVLDCVDLLEDAALPQPPQTAPAAIRTLRRCLQKGLNQWKEEDSSISFAAAVAYTLEHKAGQSPRTIQDFRQCMNALQRCHAELAEYRLNRLNARSCAHLLESTFPAPTRRRKARACLSVLFRTGVQQGWCAGNPISKVPIPQVREKTITPLMPQEIRRLLQTAALPPHSACLPPMALMLYAGVRPQEVTRLTYSCLDTEAGEVMIPPSHSKTGGGRRIPLCEPLREILLPQAAQDGTKRICPPNWNNRWRRLRQAAGFRHWRQDILRHTFASYFAKAYRNLPALQLFMGHRDVQLLLTRYVNLQGISRAEALHFFGERRQGGSNSRRQKAFWE